jgi:hemerythrin superfamily protein
MPSEQSTRQMAGPPEGGAATALLRFDHERIAFLFAHYDRAQSPEEKKTIVSKIMLEWTIHTQLEHEIFYPAARVVLQEPELAFDLEAEHTAIDALMAALVGAEPGEAAYEANVRVLGKLIAAHSKEEQGQLFQRVKASNMKLSVVGAQLKRRKLELLAVAAETDTAGAL